MILEITPLNTAALFWVLYLDDKFRYFTVHKINQILHDEVQRYFGLNMFQKISKTYMPHPVTPCLILLNHHHQQHSTYTPKSISFLDIFVTHHTYSVTRYSLNEFFIIWFSWNGLLCTLTCKGHMADCL